MRLYYTTITFDGDTQGKSEYSLGGFKSVTPIQNDLLGNLFSEISLYGIEKNSKEYIALILRNETGAEVDDVSIWFDYPLNTIVKLEVAPVAYTTQMEAVMTVNSQPFNATFYEANGHANAINIGNLGINGMVGLWFKRFILQDVVILQKQNDYLIANHGNPLVNNEEVVVNIMWNGVYGGSLGVNNL